VPPTTIDDVIATLDDVIADCIASESRLGYFAALYRTVTARVRDDIAKGGVFEDNARMERLDVTFANRYLTALAAHRRNEPCGAAWQAAFDDATNSRLVIVQHLLAGINVHINLDLGAAAAEVAHGAEIADLRSDFDAINRVLGEMVAGVLADVGELSPWIGLLDMVGGRSDEALINFSIDVARQEAWRFAERLAAAADRQPLIDERDRWVADFGTMIVKPGWLVSAALLVVRAREVSDVRRVIKVLGR